VSALARVHRAVSVAVLAVLYFAVLTPVALVLRALGRDALRLRRPTADSYWLDRGPMPGPDRLDRPY
jgi:hypothetical protein